MAANQGRADLHIKFDLSDETQARAYNILTQNTSPRGRSVYIADCIIARSDMEHMARLVVKQLAAEQPATDMVKEQPPQPNDEQKQASSTTGGRRGRPPGAKNKQKLAPKEQPSSNSLPTATVQTESEQPRQVLDASGVPQGMLASLSAFMGIGP